MVMGSGLATSRGFKGFLLNLRSRVMVKLNELCA